MKKIAFILLFFCFVPLANSQIYKGIPQLNSFHIALEQLDVSVRSEPNEFYSKYCALLTISKNNPHLESILYIYHGTLHYYLNRIDSAIYYFDASIDISKKIACSQLEMAAKIRRIFCDDRLKSAMVLTREMQAVFANSYNHKDTLNMIYSLNALALFNGRMDSTERSLTYYYEALRLAELSNNTEQEGFVLNNLGLLKLNLGANDSAYVDFQKGLLIAEQINDLRLECHLRTNVGEYYMDIDSIEAAEVEYQYVLDIGNEFGYRDMVIASMVNLSTVERRKGHFIESDILFSEGLKIAKTEHLMNTISIIYLNQASLYKDMGRYEEALPLLDSSLIYAEYLSVQDIQLAYHRTRSDLLERLDRDDEALEEYKLFQHLSDSIKDIGDSQRLDELQFRYRDEKKERLRLEEQKRYELQLKQNEVDMANFQMNVFLSIGGLVLIISLILIFYFRLKQRSDSLFSFTIVNKLEEERGKIARDLHDGLGQSMIILKNKFGNLDVEDKEKSNKIDDNISEIIEEIRGISRSLIPPELRRLGLVKAIENMMNEIEKSSSMLVTTDIECLNELELEPHQNLRLYRIIQELTTNTLKHSGATSVKVSAEFENEGSLIIIYQDNGSGLDMDKWKSARNSIGFRSIEKRIKYLRGSIKIEKPKKGFKIILKIKPE